MERRTWVTTTSAGVWVVAAIAYEDAEERSALKSDGYRWESYGKVWQKRVSSGDEFRSAWETLIGRGYTPILDYLRHPEDMVAVFQAAGLAVSEQGFMKFDSRSDRRNQLIPVPAEGLSNISAKAAARPVTW